MKLYGKAEGVAAIVLEAFQHPDTLPEKLAPVFIHRKDDTPCRKWSWRNQVVTALAMTHDARGFKQWESVGRTVKKGSKAFYILAPCTKMIEVDGEKVPRVYGFRGLPVFRIQDTEGADVASGDLAHDEWLRNLPLREVAESWDIGIQTYNGEGASMLGRFEYSGAIILGAENLRVWLHELTHAADHRNGKLSPNEPKVIKETVAELGSAILTQCLGEKNQADLGQAYEYIKMYADKGKKSVESVCFDVLERTCEAVTLILDAAQTLELVTT